MDEKVLNLLIERVEKSAQMESLHKNESWRECLKSDKKQLKEYCLKNDGKESELKRGIEKNIRKTGLMGSKETMNSEEGNIELIPQGDYKEGKRTFYEFDLQCFHRKIITVKVDGAIYYCEGVCTVQRPIEKPIDSFIVVTPNIDYSWIGKYYYEN